MSTTAVPPVTTTVPVAPTSTGADPVSSATVIRPLLREQRPLSDARRLLTDETVAALAAAGQFRTLVPRRFGGYEASLAAVVDATAEIAAGDPAAGWVVMILSCGDWLTGLFDDRAQEEVYGDSPDTRVCSVFNPSSISARVENGWRVDGCWTPASGCRHAQWAMVGVALADDPLTGGGVSPSFALVPMSELTVTDTWRAIGMRATASDTLQGRDLFIPDHRVLRTGPALEGRYPRSRTDLPRYRSAMMPTLVTHMMAPFIGMATGALELVVGAAPHRGVTFTDYARQMDSTAFQMGVSAAALRIDSARALAHRAAAEVDGHAAAGTHPAAADRARIRGWTGHVVAQCREAVDLLVSAYGAAAFSESNPLQGIVRDIQTASRHAIANPVANTEIYGRALLGVEPNISILI
jgi:3-hydroxy-9,10-secoandrosta-1,3,5(10)-triene-9,17-dione monooxygenase